MQTDTLNDYSKMSSCHKKKKKKKKKNKRAMMALDRSPESFSPQMNLCSFGSNL